MPGLRETAIRHTIKTTIARYKMPKLKTKSSIKGRFSRTASGKIKRNVAYKRHCLDSKSVKMRRQARGTRLLSDGDTKLVRQFMPYDR